MVWGLGEHLEEELFVEPSELAVCGDGEQLVAEFMSTRYSCRQGVEHIDGWLRRTRRVVEAIDATVVDEFVRHHLPRCQCPPPCSTSIHQVRTALRHLVVVLGRTGRVLSSKVKTSVAEKMVEEFAAHLLDTRGAADATRASSARYAREFLADQFGHGKIDFSRIEPSAVVAFFAARGGRWSPAR